ncbi:MAG TPA: ribonuclease PH [Fibrobacteria bacterium]|nr:ribonuclease PH [Fibrobacteria bacterium]
MTRSDNRSVESLRPFSLELGFVSQAEGSVLVTAGKTRVLCNASIDKDVPRWLKGQGKGWVTAEYALMPRSTNTRVDRERKGPSGRTQEIQRLVGRSLRACTDLVALGERQIIVDCDVIEADGGTRTASITGAFVSLALALRKLKAEQGIDRQILTGWLSAVSVGVVEGAPMLDLCYEEDSKAGTDMNVVAFEDGRLVEVQGTAEHGAYSRAELDRMLDLSLAGIQTLCGFQKTALGGILP